MSPFASGYLCALRQASLEEAHSCRQFELPPETLLLSERVGNKPWKMFLEGVAGTSVWIRVH